MEHEGLREVRPSDAIATLWERKWFVLAIAGAIVAGSVAYAFLKQPLFTATATVMPVGNSGQSSALSQYATIATSMGLSLPSVGGGAPDQQIMAILTSRTLCESLVQDLDLVPQIVKSPDTLRGGDPFQAAVGSLQRDVVRVSEDQETGVISIAVTFFDRFMAQRIANRAVEVLEEILNQQNAALSNQSTRNLEDQISEQWKKVQSLQAELASFQKQTRIISPEGQVADAIALYTQLLQQKLSLEAALSVLEDSLSPGNPQISSTRARLDAINAQIGRLEGTVGLGSFAMGSAPDLMVRFENISGELDIATRIYAGLLVVYQNQKLQQAQSQVFVHVIDTAVVPDKPSQPNKRLVVVVGCLVGAVVGIAAALLLVIVTDLGRDVRRRLAQGQSR